MRRMPSSFFFKLLLYQDFTVTGSFLTLHGFLVLSFELGFISDFWLRVDGQKRDDLRLKGEPTLIFLVLVRVTLVRTVEEADSELARPGMEKPGEEKEFCFFPFIVGVCFPLQNFPRQV